MAPKVPEKQHPQHQKHHQHSLQNNSALANKHSNQFHISAFTLCHNKRLKLKRSRYEEFLRHAYKNKQSTPQQNIHKTEMRREKLKVLQADVTIDLLSDEEQNKEKNNSEQPKVVVYPERMCLERAAILGLMPVERSMKPPPLVPILTNHKQIPQIPTKQKIMKSQQQQLEKPQLIVTMPKLCQQQPRKRKSKPQKRCSLPLPPKTPIILNHECIVLSDDSNDVPIVVPPSAAPQPFTAILEPPQVSVACSTTSQIPCLLQQNTMQVDEEVTISLVPRSLNATTCASRSSLNNSNGAKTNQNVFPMLPDETTVHTVIANRIYELSLSKLREGLASCGIPEFADGQQKISPQRRKGMVHQPPMVSPPQAPISLKLSSDLSISLISDDEDDGRQKNCRHEPILSPAFLQKLPVNVSIAPVPAKVPMVRPSSNHATESRKLKLG